MYGNIYCTDITWIHCSKIDYQVDQPFDQRGRGLWIRDCSSECGLNTPGTKLCGFKNVWICVDGALWEVVQLNSSNELIPVGRELKISSLNKFHRALYCNLKASIPPNGCKSEAITRNRPFPSSPGPLFQNEGRCSAFDVEIIFHSHANKTHFHKKGCAPSLILKVRVFGTRKWRTELTCLFRNLPAR